MPPKKPGAKKGTAAKYEIPPILEKLRVQEQAYQIFYGHGWGRHPSPRTDDELSPMSASSPVSAAEDPTPRGWNVVDDDCQCKSCLPHRVVDLDKQRRMERQRREREKKKRRKGEEDGRQAAEERRREEDNRRQAAATRITTWAGRAVPAMRQWCAMRKSLHGPPLPDLPLSGLADTGGPPADAPRSSKPTRRALVIGIDDYEDPRVPPTQGNVADSLEVGRLLKSLGFVVEYCNTRAAEESRRPTKANLVRLLQEVQESVQGRLTIVYIACRGAEGSLVGYNPVNQHPTEATGGGQLDARKRLALTLRTSMRQTSEAESSVLRYLLPSDAPVTGGHHRASDVLPLDDLLRIVKGTERIELGASSRPMHTSAVFVDAMPLGSGMPAESAAAAQQQQTQQQQAPAGFAVTLSTVTAEAVYDYATARYPGVRGLLSCALQRALGSGVACSAHAGVTLTSVCRHIHEWLTQSPPLQLRCIARDPWQREAPPPDLFQGPPRKHKRGRDLEKRHAAGVVQQREQQRDEAVSREPWRLTVELPRRRLRGRRGSTPRLYAGEGDSGHDLEFVALVPPQLAADFLARSRVWGRESDRPSSATGLHQSRRRVSAAPPGAAQRRSAFVFTVRLSVPATVDTCSKEWEQEMVDCLQRLASNSGRLQPGLAEAVRRVVVPLPSLGDALRRARADHPEAWEHTVAHVCRDAGRLLPFSVEARPLGQAALVLEVDTEALSPAAVESVLRGAAELAERVTDCGPAEQEVDLHVLGTIMAHWDLDEALRCGYANSPADAEDDIGQVAAPDPYGARASVAGAQWFAGTGETRLGEQGGPRLIGLAQALRPLSIFDDGLLAAARRDKIFLFVVAVSGTSGEAKARQIAQVSKAAVAYHHCSEFFYFEHGLGVGADKEQKALGQRSPQVAELQRLLRDSAHQSPQLFLCDVARRRSYTLSSDRPHAAPQAVAAFCDEHLRGGLQDLVPPVKGSKVVGWGAKSSKYVLIG